MKVIISGGGTGGHIFPAIAIANCISEKMKEKNEECNILFVGAEGKMEMEKVPQAGYKIIGLKIAGFQRKKLWKNISLPFKVFSCLKKAKKIIKDFNPDVVIGVGGYASGPTLKMANKLNIPTLLQEQNSYAGVTNKLLAKKAQTICTAYDNMDKFFENNHIIKTGNPIRKNIALIEKNKEFLQENAVKNFKIKENVKTVLVIGGSLGARTINNSIEKHLDYFLDNNIQLIWQTGKFYYKDIEERVNEKYKDNDKFKELIRIREFIKEMDEVYSVADIIISRAGATSISELCVVGKPAIFVPSPNVAEDHQTKNAMALVNKKAALMVKDMDMEKDIVEVLDRVLKDEELRKEMSTNIKQLGIVDADERIVNEVLKIVKK
jgi:UDP-N-acetylglucosamine--N-acetylmuramyl-(pentapeptide) pyrophosphoryl-undecaprenol N-acetylglucosamine transferase